MSKKELRMMSSQEKIIAVMNGITANAVLGEICREWLRGCTCASASDPSECQECTKNFLDALIQKAKELEIPIGENAIK